MTTAPSLDLTRLEHVSQKGAKTIARCPACAEADGDKAGDHLCIDAQGRFTCIKHQGAEGKEHRRRIFELVGIRAEAPAHRPPTKRKLRSWPEPETAAKACTPKGFTLAKVYHYPRDGKPLAAVARYEKPGDKTFRQFRVNGTGWESGGPSGLWSLYHVEGLSPNGCAWVVEGEKCQHAASSIGLTAVCSAGGSKAPHRSDWTPLAGRDVCILLDNDKDGEKYGSDVAALLHAAGARSVKTVALEGLPAKGDLYDFIEGRSGQTPEAIRSEVESAATAAPDWTPPAKAPTAAATDIRARLWDIRQEKLGATETHRKSAAAVIEWLSGRGRFYFHAERRDFAGVMFFDAERKLLLPVQGDAFLAWMANALSMNRAERCFAFVASAVETEGLSERATGIEPATYWSATPSACYLSNGPGQMARVSAEGVALVDNGTDDVLFPYGATLAPWALTTPADPFESCALFRDMSAAAPHGRDLFKLWACALPTDQRTKPPCCVSGEIGSGKTRAIRGVFELYGMPERVSAVHKNGEADFWVAMEAGGLTCFDNADTRVDWLADALAAAATGGTLERRKLYKDMDRVCLRARSWVCVTSASPTFAADAGLADRLLVVRLNRRTGETAETALSDEIKRNRDAGLSWICQTLSRALADVEPVPEDLNARHPDFARLAVRIGRAMGRGKQAVAALRAAEADKGLFNVENDWIGAALLELLRAGPFSGTAAELLEALKETDPSLDGKLSAKRLGKRLSKLWPHLESVFHAEQERDTHTKRLHYTFRPPSVAGFAGFETAFSEKSYTRKNRGGFSESASETPQTPQTVFEPPAESAPTPAAGTPPTTEEWEDEFALMNNAG